MVQCDNSASVYEGSFKFGVDIVTWKVICRPTCGWELPVTRRTCCRWMSRSIASCIRILQPYLYSSQPRLSYRLHTTKKGSSPPSRTEQPTKFNGAQMESPKRGGRRWRKCGSVTRILWPQCTDGALGMPGNVFAPSGDSAWGGSPESKIGSPRATAFSDWGGTGSLSPGTNVTPPF